MNIDSVGAEFPPPFYTLPEAFATTPEMLYFQCAMLVNVANETRALRLAIENFHKKVKMEVSNDKPGTVAPPDTGG